MKNIKLLGTSLLLATVLSFTGCGEDDSTGGGEAIDFPSDSIQAESTLDNGKEVAAVVATDDIMGLPIPDGLQNQSNNINITLIAIESYNIVKEQIEKDKKNEPNYTQEVSKDDCTNGGTVTTSLSASLTSTSGTYTTKYEQCNENNTILDGTIEYSASLLDYANEELNSLHVYFVTDFTIDYQETNKDTKIKKNSNFTIETVNSKLKLTVSLQATRGSNYYGQENAVYYIYDNDNTNMSYIYQVSGKVYIKDLTRFVEYDTTYDMSQTPFAYNSIGHIVSGEARYNMSNNGKVKIVVESENNIVVSVDADGDGHYELN